MASQAGPNPNEVDEFAAEYRAWYTPGSGSPLGTEQGVGKSSWPLLHRGEEVSSAAGIPARICSFWQASGVRWSSTMDAPPGPSWCGITLYRWSRREGEVVLLRRAWAILLVTPCRTYVLIAEWPCKGASDSGGRNPAGETTPCGPPLPRGDGRLFCGGELCQQLAESSVHDRPTSGSCGCCTRVPKTTQHVILK
jgi:hypothetical protein